MRRAPAIFRALLLLSALMLPGRGADSAGISPPMEWSGAFGPYSEFSAQVIRDVESWRRLWELLGRAPPAAFDAESRIALAVFLGLRRTGGYDVTIEPVAGTENLQIFRVREIRPGPGAFVPQVLTTPYRILVLPGSARPALFLVGGRAGACLYIPAGERARIDTAVQLPAAPPCP